MASVFTVGIANEDKTITFIELIDQKNETAFLLNRSERVATVFVYRNFFCFFFRFFLHLYLMHVFKDAEAIVFLSKTSNLDNHFMKKVHLFRGI